MHRCSLTPGGAESKIERPTTCELEFTSIKEQSVIAFENQTLPQTLLPKPTSFAALSSADDIRSVLADFEFAPISR